jgi:phosphoglycolate phosphatase-like HAD superfamily hydrolase
MRRLVLFDIDGTLLGAGGAGARAFRDALVEVFGTPGPIDGHSFAGKTDPQIALELLQAAGLEQDDITAGLPELWRGYLARLEPELARSQIQVLPGVPELLTRIEEARAEMVLGLLTGNLRDGARLKLDAAGIGFRRFAVGAYGCDHADRAELPAVAVERAEEHTGRRFHRKEIVIIGDTPNDIACGESLGVRTIAVTTGSYTGDQLAACGPDHLFTSLEDTEAVMESITAD